MTLKKKKLLDFKVSRFLGFLDQNPEAKIRKLTTDVNVTCDSHDHQNQEVTPSNFEWIEVKTLRSDT